MRLSELTDATADALEERRRSPPRSDDADRCGWASRGWRARARPCSSPRWCAASSPAAGCRSSPPWPRAASPAPTSSRSPTTASPASPTRSIWRELAERPAAVAGEHPAHQPAARHHRVHASHRAAARAGAGAAARRHRRLSGRVADRPAAAGAVVRRLVAPRRRGRARAARAGGRQGLARVPLHARRRRAGRRAGGARRRRRSSRAICRTPARPTPS